MTGSAKIWLTLCFLLCFTATAAASAPQFADETKISGLRWKKRVIPIAFSNSLLKQNPVIKTDSDILGAITRSLETWESVANIEFRVAWTDKVSASPPGNFGDGVSLVTIAPTAENVLIFSGETNDVSARTRVFFNRQGMISEADIVLNPYQQFSTDGSFGTFDLESTLTHEIGHLLGLEHSSVIGATMNEHQGKNGVYNLSAFTPRSLALDDVIAVQGVYGAKSDREECCGGVSGKISAAGSKAAKNLFVWLEESATGRVSAGTAAGADGSFQFEGLQAGRYRLYVQDSRETKEGEGLMAAEDLGDVEVSKGKTVTVNRRLNGALRGVEAEYVGFNGQLAKLAVPVNSGRSYLIYVGGRNLNAADLQIGSNSPFINVTQINTVNLDYGKDVSVVSFEVRIEPETPLGEYSIFLRNKSGAVSYLVGSLTVEKYLNPWNIYILD